VNLDTGRPTHGADYPLADETYAELLRRLEKRDFRDVSPDLRSNILDFYSDREAAFAGKDDDDWQDVLRALEELEGKASRDASAPPRLRAPL
jgi:hypothetical protein